MTRQFDQYVLLPTMDLYDNQVMAMALNAAKDMYERGELQIKDFLKAYGDFLTPITADLNWWNLNVTGRVRDAINNIYARGGDPLRNAQDRAELSMLINNMPYGDMAFKRERAKNAEEYYKNMATLRMNDKYNEDFSRFLQEDPNQWALNSAGVTSPTVFSDLNAKTAHWFDGVNRKGYLYTKDGYDYFGVKPEDLKLVLNSQIPDFINTQYGKYQLELARRQVGPDASDAEAIEQLKKNIIDYNRELTINPTREMNPVAALELKDRYEARKLDREFRYAAALQQLKNAGKTGSGSRTGDGTGVDENGNPLPTPLHEQIKDSVNQKLLSSMGLSEESKSTTQKSNVQMIIDYYQNKIDQIEKNKGKQVLDGFETVTEPNSQVTKYSSVGMPIPQFGPGVTKQVPKYRYEYDSSKDREYLTYKTKLEHYKRIANGEGDLTALELAMYDKIVFKIQNKQQLNKAEENIFKHLNNKRTAFWTDYKDDFFRARSNEADAKSRNGFAKANDEFYGMFTFTPGDEAGKNVALGMFTEYASKAKPKDLAGEYYVVNFNNAGIEYAPIRKANVSGPSRYKYNSIQNKFSEWLKSGQVQGLLLDESVQFATIPKEFSAPGKSQLDILANPCIEKQAFLDFFNTLSGKWTQSDLAEVARQLGLVPVDAKGTILNQDKNGYNSATYYKVPTIKTFDNAGGFQFGQMDDQYNIYKYGAATAYKNAINNEAASLTP